MNIRYLIYFLIISALVLYNYGNTGRSHVKAKVIQLFVPAIVILLCSNVLAEIISLLTNMRETIRSWSQNLSSNEAMVLVTLKIIYLPIEFFMIFLGIGLIKRMENVRAIFVKLILWFIPYASIMIYMYSKKNNLSNPDLYFLFGSIFSILILKLISSAYKRKFMIDFFKTSKT